MGIFRSYLHKQTMKKRARFLPEEGADQQKAQSLVREAKEERREEKTKAASVPETHVSLKQKDSFVGQKLRKINIETAEDYRRRVSSDRIRSRYIDLSDEDCL